MSVVDVKVYVEDTLGQVVPPSVESSNRNVELASVPYLAAYTLTTPAPPDLSKFMETTPVVFLTRTDCNPLNLSDPTVLPRKASKMRHVPDVSVTLSFTSFPAGATS